MDRTTQIRLAVIDSERNQASRDIRRLQRYIGQGCNLTAQQRTDLDAAVMRYSMATAREHAILDSINGR